MQTPQQDHGGTRDGGDPACGEDPARGAAAPGFPSLVNNPPNAKSEASEAKTWSDQQCKIRRACIDRIRHWQSHGYEVLWVTLTSGVGAKEGDEHRPHKKLRRHMQELRRRVADRWGVPGIEYVCVETMEGNGVLHMLWAAKADRGQFYIPYKWLSREWEAIHGAWNVWVARVKEGKSSTRRLSWYIVSQYCGGQDGLVRLSQSRMGHNPSEKCARRSWRLWLAVISGICTMRGLVRGGALGNSGVFAINGTGWNFAMPGMILCCMGAASFSGKSGFGLPEGCGPYELAFRNRERT
jgi:hypothetical protein